jgi:tetratricopeptide (TPR) repeat protein
VSNRLTAFAILLLVSCACGFAHDPAHESSDSPGSVVLPISCDASVQADFNRAVALLHHMTYPQARAAFVAIQQRDPSCAMARWGIAMTLFQPLWPTRPNKADLQRGWNAVQEALPLAAAYPRELAYLQAIASFYRDPDSSDYWRRIDDWEAAMASLHAAYPQDQEAAAFYALALLASARPGPSQQEHSRRALELLLPIYRQHPDHPGAMHYIIHANDIPGRERENLDIVRRYERIAPDNPHALHMPTHIYTRLGDWEGVVRGNLRAAAAALNYPAGEHGEWVWDEFPHAIEYLVYAYLQQGADEAARTQITRLLAVSNLEPSAKTAFHLASTRARYALERHAWREAANLMPRKPATLEWDRYPWPEAVIVFARGYGNVQLGDRGTAQREKSRLEELQQRAAAAGETVFAQQIRVLALELAARIAHAARDDAAAIELMQQARDLETSTPKPAVTPAATLPASELLGDLLLEIQRPREALDAYRQSLQSFPRRFNSELGVARAQAGLGDTPGAARGYCELLQTAQSGTRASLLPDVRRLLASQQAAHTTCERPTSP